MFNIFFICIWTVCLQYRYIIIELGSVMAASFTVMNGVKQGGVLSPVLFAVYHDGLLLRIQESCHMGGHYAGALAYADDITLISPSMTSLRKMSSICKLLMSMIFCLMEVKVSYYFSNAVVVMYPLLVLLYMVSWAGCQIQLGHTITSNDRDNITKSSNPAFGKVSTFHLLNLANCHHLLLINCLINIAVVFTDPLCGPSVVLLFKRCVLTGEKH